MDWDSWVDRRRSAYWTQHLPNRVRVATYVGGFDLDRCWSVVSHSLESEPRTTDERLELARLLREESEPVSTLLRERPTAYVLRTRIVAESIAAARSAGKVS